MVHFNHLPEDVLTSHILTYLDIDGLSKVMLTSSQLYISIVPALENLYQLLASTPLYLLSNKPTWAATLPLFSLLLFNWGFRTAELLSKATTSAHTHTYYGPDPNSTPAVSKSFLSQPQLSHGTHDDKITGLVAIATVGGGALFAAGSFDATVSIMSVYQPTKSQLTLRTANRNVITCLDTFIQNDLCVVVAGVKRGSLVAWTTTLYGCNQASSFSANNSVVNETRNSLEVSSEHIRSIKHLHRNNMDLIVVGDGDGRIIIIHLIVTKSTELLPPEIHLAVLQSSWVHESPVVAIQSVSSGGFVSVERAGSVALWCCDGSLISKTDSSALQQQMEQQHQKEQKQKEQQIQKIHYSLTCMNDVTGQSGRAVTCMELIEWRRGMKENKAAAAAGYERKYDLETANDATLGEGVGVGVGVGDLLVILGTRGSFGTRSKSMRTLLKDTTIIGYNMTRSERLWALPNARTVNSILPLGLRHVLVVSEVDDDELEHLSLWDTAQKTVVQEYTIGKTPREYSRIHQLLPILNETTGTIDHIVLGTTDGSLLTIKVGF